MVDKISHTGIRDHVVPVPDAQRKIYYKKMYHLT
jgi:hypothetical protein